MLSPTPLLLLSLLGSLAAAQNITGAQVVSNNPAGASYRAALTGKVSGSLNATSNGAGKPVSFTLELMGLPVGTGPFKFHIHEKPVPTDGNCTGTGAHLDPYLRTQVPACDSAKPATCEVGDLSGKYGAVGSNSSSVVKIFNDPYVALNPADKQFFGNLSFVVHDASSARIACANFTMVAAAGDGDACDE
ncbi:hypothetical protein NKR19_g7421 [Coniochaeta hoffmannii]|uniref:superoxide dismutase n=1 Tax=Coniochaeta hoffmannii TaxID=91930 RepID=A0AA38VM59_9PEZI|nr:hypothetical protein NKR19_g7421 [Coniochaeta hoffmannii]